jgi:hypothetical protein
VSGGVSVQTSAVASFGLARSSVLSACRFGAGVVLLLQASVHAATAQAPETAWIRHSRCETAPDRAQGRQRHRCRRPDRHGNARDRHNLRQRVVAPVVAKAEELLAERDGQPLPKGITPHKLRHTFASVLFAIGKDPTYVMHQLGHTDPAFTLRVYAHMMRRSPEEREALKALVEGHDWTLGEDTAEASAEQR